LGVLPFRKKQKIKQSTMQRLSSHQKIGREARTA